MNQIVSAIGLSLLLATATSVTAQSACKVGVEAPPVGFWTWAPESEIQVYVLESDFEDKELRSLLMALKAWNAVSDSAGSKVKFKFRGTTANPLYCENCLTLRRGPVFDKSKRHLTELRAYSSARNRIMTWANIVIDPLLTNPKSLTNALAHELGHSLGLLDCYSCRDRSTVMIQFKTVNASNEMNGPSVCDLAQVKAVYQSVALELRRTRPPKPIVIDEGEEPVEDDTPVVIPKP